MGSDDSKISRPRARPIFISLTNIFGQRNQAIDNSIGKTEFHGVEVKSKP